MQSILDHTEDWYNIDNIGGTVFFNETGSSEQFKFNKVDGFQQIFDAYIKNSYFLWTVLVLLLNAKNWKKPVVSVLVIHWFLRSSGDLIRNVILVREVEPNTVFPFDKTNWIISNSVAHVLWLAGEIVGDWYPLLRTKAVTNDEKSMRKVYATCILYNIVKVYGMWCFFKDLNKLDFSYQASRKPGAVSVIENNMDWWIDIMFILITSCLYDIAVILTLKSNLFNKLKKRHNKNSLFLEKFKEISELRIMISMLASIIFLPFVIVFIFYIEYNYIKYKDIKMQSDSEIEHLREVVINFNYSLMYIDQILLRIIAKKSKNSSSNNSSSYGNSSSSNSTNAKFINVNYKKNNLYNDNPVTSDTTKLLVRPSYQGIMTTNTNYENTYRNTGNPMDNNRNNYEFNNYNNTHRNFANSNYRNSIYNTEANSYRNMNTNMNRYNNGGTDNYYNKNSMYFMDKANNNR